MGLTHIDTIVDSDLACVIDPITRKIKPNDSKSTIMQYDHNSERISFTLNRFIEGHDMSETDRIVVKYLNVKTADMYVVNDIYVSDETITFTWLISGNATQEVGSLIFLINFRCYDDDGTITFNWSTQPCSAYSIVKGVESMDSNPIELYDFWARYKGLVKEVINNTDILQEKVNTLTDSTEVLDEEVADLTKTSDILEVAVNELTQDVPELQTKVSSLTNSANVLEGKIATLDRTVADDPIYVINDKLTEHGEAIKLGSTERTDFTKTNDLYVSVNNKALGSLSSYYTHAFEVTAGEVYIIYGVSQGDAGLYLFIPSDTTLETICFPTEKANAITYFTDIFIVPSDGVLYLGGRTGQFIPQLLTPFDSSQLKNKVDKSEFDKHSAMLVGQPVDLTFEADYFSITKHTFASLSQYLHATITINKGDTYFISGSAIGDMCLYAFVGESGAITTTPPERSGNIRYENESFTATENGTLYVNICRYEDENVTVRKTINKDVNQLFARVTTLENHASASPWNGCKANFIGDSIIYGSYGDVVTMVQEKLGLKVARNYGVGGARLASTEYDSQYAPVVLRYADMDDDADIIWVAAGTNDYSTQVPIGENNSTDITTFKGALNTIMDGLRAKYPDKVVVFASILHRYNDNKFDIKADEYREAIRERCEAKHFVFYDSYRYSGFDFAKDYYDKVLTDDGLHPNEKGASILARKIAGFLNCQ